MLTTNGSASATRTTMTSTKSATIDILTHAPSWPRHSNISLPPSSASIPTQIPPPSMLLTPSSNKSSTTRPKINTTPNVLRKIWKAFYRRAIEVRNIAVSNGRQTLVIILFVLCIILIKILGGSNDNDQHKLSTTSARNQQRAAPATAADQSLMSTSKRDVAVAQPPIFLPHVRVNPALMRGGGDVAGVPVRNMREHSVRSRAGWIDLDAQQQQRQRDEDEQKQKEKDDEDNVMPQNNDEDEENGTREQEESDDSEGLRDARHDDRRRLGQESNL